MGLLSAINIAVAGLNVNQQQLDTLSQNISNANTANYTNEVVNQQANFDSGTGEGVSIQSISRQINEYLTAEVRGQTSINSAASTVQNYYTQLETLLGQPGSTGTVDQNIDSFFTSLQNLANTPSVSAEATAVNAGVTVATQISNLATSIQTMRLQADGSISSAITSINSDLQNLHTLNISIASATASGQNTSGLLDSRDAALLDISQYMNINTTFQSDGEVTLNSTGGVTLLTQSNASQISYTPLSSIQTLTNDGNLSPIVVTPINSAGTPVGTPVDIATGGTSGQVTTSLTGGSLLGLLQMRDTILPNVLSQLDQLAGTLRDQVNAINNSGTSFPPPNSYTGSRAVTGSQTSTYSGNLQLAVLGANGTTVSSPYSDETNGLQPLNLNLSTLNYGQGNGVLSVNNIIDAINQYYGSPQNKTEIGSLNNVQLQMATNTVSGTSGALTFGFSLNNLTGTNANFYVTGTTVLDSQGNTIATSGNTTTTIPEVALTSYQASANNTITVTTTGANALSAGETIYIAGTTASTSVGGVAASSIGGYYTVNSVAGNTFQITVAGVTGDNSTANATGADALPPYANVAGGQTMSTQSDGTITANIGSAPTSPYYTVEVNIATVNSLGAVETSTVSYQVTNGTTGVMNNVIGATNATGNGTIVAPNTVQPLVTAELVDANGNVLSPTSSQAGYLKITANNSSQTIAINQDDSKELGMPSGNPPQAGTNQGFSQYFGLNNFFNTNSLTSTGDTVANSAINLSVNSSLVNNPALISTGSLVKGNQPTDPTAAPNYSYVLESGDNSISQALAGLATTSFKFNATGGLPAATTTLVQYSGNILSDTSSNATSATSNASNSQTLLNGYTSAAQNVSGVNLDQQLANTVIYQNAYTASARIITVVEQMFTDLLGIIQ